MNSHATRNGTAQNEGKGAVGFGLVLRGLRRYPLTTFLFVLLAGAAGAAVWFFLPLPKMTAYNIFHIQAQSNALIKPEGDEKIDFKIYQQTQSAMVKHRLVLNATLSHPDVAHLQIIKNEREPLVWLDSQLKVDFKLGPELMRVSLEGDNADELKAILDALTAAYIKDVRTKDMAKRLARYNLLVKHFAENDSQLQAQRKRLKTLAETLETTELGRVEREKYIQKEIGALQSDIHQLEREEGRIGSDIKLVEKQIEKVKANGISEEEIEQFLLKDPRYQQLLEIRRAVAAGIEELEKLVRPGLEPKALTEKRKELALRENEVGDYAKKQRPAIEKGLKDDSLRSLNKQLASMEMEIESKKKYREVLEARLVQFQSLTKGNSVGQVEIDTVKAEIAQTEKIREHIRGEMESMRPELDTTGRVSAPDPAYVVPGIEGQRRLKYTLMAVFGMMLIGLGVVTGLEYRNRRVVNADEVTSGLGLKVIGTVPALPRRALARGASMPNGQNADWQQHLAESVDNTRTLLLYGMDGTQSVRTILVTSALSGEGKTSLAGHLAVSLARAGFKTVLVDGDMRRPSLHRVLGVPLNSGLSELLRGEATLEQVLQPTPAPGLSIIPAGIWNSRLPQVLAGNAWRDIKTSLEAEFDYVIVDSPPLLPVADSLLLARHVDGVLLSLLHDVSRMGAVAAAKDRLAIVGTHILGVVINGVNNDFYGPSYPYCRMPQAPVGTATTA